MTLLRLKKLSFSAAEEGFLWNTGTNKKEKIGIF